MAKRTVVWADTAIKQRREILRYWTLRNGSTVYAEKLIRMTKNRIKTILDNHFRESQLIILIPKNQQWGILVSTVESQSINW